MLKLDDILAKTEAKVKAMNPGDPSAALRSTQTRALAAVLVEEVNKELNRLTRPR